MIRGLGYLRSTNDLETVAVGSKNGAPVLLRDLGSVGLWTRHSRGRCGVERRRVRRLAALWSCGKA
jgi:Cu/Ag efflux pump CusA